MKNTIFVAFACLLFALMPPWVAFAEPPSGNERIYEIPRGTIRKYAILKDGKAVFACVEQANRGSELIFRSEDYSATPPIKTCVNIARSSDFSDIHIVPGMDGDVYIVYTKLSKPGRLSVFPPNYQSSVREAVIVNDEACRQLLVPSGWSSGLVHFSASENGSLVAARLEHAGQSSRIKTISIVSAEEEKGAGFKSSTSSK